ncbi:GAT domain [Nesidiocoris tenuis]|uniref:GAT domain n=1 Tax=Nesidiocoris tenuis TaxID=355587 RepID=A0ABN7B0J8_9HEMI|nr:GAT domain [Nesidiocoris tenuis]
MANQIDIITTSLEALIQRATSVNNQGVDTAAIDAFCGLINREPDCAQMAAKFIAAKVHSLQEWEAMQALLVLETCVKRCTSHFLPEIGKFRFLNELIKLVSPKYLGAHTPESVRRRVLELMYSWTLFYPKEAKIKEAYEMLKKQGVVKEEPAVPQPKEPPPQKHQASILQDEEKSALLQKLLQSKNPQDLQAANRLIKSMVKEEERRNEEKWRSHRELETVVNNCRLLSEMLDSYQDGYTSDQELELIRELYSTCHNMRPALFKLASTNSDAEFCHEVLTVNDELGEVFSRYSSLIPAPPAVLPTSNSQLLRPKQPDVPPVNSSSLLDLSPDSSEKPPSSSAKDLSELGVVLSMNESLNRTNAHAPNSDVLKELFEDNVLTSAPHVPTQDASQVFNNIRQQTIPTPQNVSAQAPGNNPKPKPFEELDILSKMLMEQSLSSNQKPPSATVDSSETADNGASANPSSEASDLQNSKDDDLLLNISSWDVSSVSDVSEVKERTDNPSPSLRLTGSNSSTPFRSKAGSSATEKSVLPLGDISLSIESIRPSAVSPFQALDEKNEISTVIHLAKDTPRPDVAVYVITTTSKSQSPISNFLFQPIVPKCCRLRLMAPSSTELPAHNPFLPAAAIIQIMLIASPTKEPILLKYVISYTTDEETITEMGQIDTLPMTED